MALLRRRDHVGCVPRPASGGNGVRVGGRDRRTGIAEGAENLSVLVERPTAGVSPAASQPCARPSSGAVTPCCTGFWRHRPSRRTRPTTRPSMSSPTLTRSPPSRRVRSPSRSAARSSACLFSVNYFCRRIASPDLLPGEHRCLRIPATEGRHDVDDQSASAAGVGDGGGRAVSAEHASREGADPGRVRRAHRVPPQALHPSPEWKLGSAGSTAGAPVCVRRGRDRGAGRAVGGIGPRVREAPEGVAADLGAGTRAARARDPGPAGARATDGGERRHDRPPPGVGEGGDSRSAPAPSFRRRQRTGQGSGAHVRRLAGWC